MRVYHFITSIGIFLTTTCSFSQTFNNNTDVNIPDCGAQICSSIPISGLATSINGTFGLESVTIKINHPFDSDLDIFLVAPDGTTIELSTDNGGAGDNYGSGTANNTGPYTVFNMSGAAGSVTGGAAPFTNTYIPEGNLGDANNGQNPNGTWQLCVTDDACSDVGFINAWQITFGNSPAPPSGGGGGCPTNGVIGSIPFTATSQTTCGSGDDFSSSDVCGSSYMGGDDYVYTYTPAANECVSISLSNTGTWVGLFVSDACPSSGSANCVASNTNSSGNPSIGGVNLTAGTTYYITISTFPAPQCTPFDISIIYCPPPPANDECSGAFPVSVGASGNGCATAVGGTIQNATGSSQSTASCFGTENDDVWFSFSAPASGEVDISLLNISGSTTDMYHSVWSGTCPALTLVSGSCSDPNTSTVSGLTPGATYYLRVNSYGSGSYNTTFDVCIEDGSSCTSPPVNDDCPAATSVPVGILGGNCSTAVLGTINCATASSQSAVSCAGTEDDDVWFSFVAPAGGSVDINLINVSGTTTDLYHSVWSGTCPSLSLVAGTCSDPNSSTVTGLTPGATYYLRVYSYTATGGQEVTFSVCIEDIVCSLAGATCGLNYSVSNITYSPVSYATGTILSTTDDRLSNEIPIGFTFCFDGIGYNSLFVSSNAYIVFPGCLSDVDGNYPVNNGYSSWSISGPIPNTNDAPRNAILAPWHDIDPSVSGTIRYQVSGAAPNRIFTAKFDNIAMFSASCNSLRFSAQIKLFETTNDIEVHIGEKVVCTGWNSGQAVLGLHNWDGSIARVPTGTNAPNQWTASNQAVKFTNNCGPCGVVLPVEMLEFDASTEHDGNEVHWKVASETDLSHYEVEHSTDGQHFVNLGMVDAMDNSSAISNYNYLHNNPPHSINYYRLKMVDIDGEFSYSRIAVLDNRKGIQDWQVYPNPATNLVYLRYENELDDQVEFRIRDITGRVAKSITYRQKKGTNSLELSIDELVSGSYFIDMYSTTLRAVIKTEKLIKQ